MGEPAAVTWKGTGAVNEMLALSALVKVGDAGTAVTGVRKRQAG